MALNKKSRPKKKLHLASALVIAHGKSEIAVVQKITQPRRLPIEIHSRDKGRSSIQVNSLKTELSTCLNLRSLAGMRKHHPKIDGLEGGRKPIQNSNFKIFPVMDLDDCTREQARLYKNKAMFRDYWAYEYIVPIFNYPNLEIVMEQAGLPFKNRGDDRKKEYYDLIPEDLDELKTLIANLEKNPNTNMDVLIRHLLRDYVSN